MVGQTKTVLGREGWRECQVGICKLDLVVRAEPWRNKERGHGSSSRVNKRMNEQVLEACFSPHPSKALYFILNENFLQPNFPHQVVGYACPVR